MPRKRRGGSTPLSPTKPATAAAGAPRRARPAGPRPYTAGRCRSPGPRRPTPPSRSRSSSPPSASARRSTTPSAACRAGPGCPGFRPGQGARGPSSSATSAPGAVLDDAVEHLVQDALPRGARRGGHPAADQRRRRRRPGRGGSAAHLQGDRPGPARGRAGRLQELQLPSRDRDHRRRRASTRSSRSCATRTRPSTAVEGRGAQDGDYAVISFVGTRDGEPFEGGRSERMPLILGQERLIPGFEANLLGLEVGGSTEFDITFPDDYPETELAGKSGPFRGRAARAAREGPAGARRTDFVGTLGDFADLDALRTDVKTRLERNALDRARHGFADQIIDYAVANADRGAAAGSSSTRRSRSCTTSSVATLARQGITEEAYLKARREDRRRTCTRSSGRAPRSASGRCSCCRRSPTRRA